MVPLTSKLSTARLEAWSRVLHVFTLLPQSIGRIAPEACIRKQSSDNWVSSVFLEAFSQLRCYTLNCTFIHPIFTAWARCFWLLSVCFGFFAENGLVTLDREAGGWRKALGILRTSWLYGASCSLGPHSLLSLQLRPLPSCSLLVLVDCLALLGFQGSWALDLCWLWEFNPFSIYANERIAWIYIGGPFVERMRTVSCYCSSCDSGNAGLDLFGGKVIDFANCSLF